MNIRLQLVPGCKNATIASLPSCVRLVREVISLTSLLRLQFASASYLLATS
jgi:hypothetical protein